MNQKDIEELLELRASTARIQTLIEVFDFLKGKVPGPLLATILDLANTGKHGNPAPITDDARLNELLR
jgi:hypothetical protein